MKHNRVIHWFRNDLRLADNETLSKAIQAGKEVIPVYCFDPRMWETTALGYSKTGTTRTEFLISAVQHLWQDLQSLGSDLIILHGKPEEEVIKLAEEAKVGAIFYSQEVTSEEKSVDKALEKAAFAKGITTESFWQSTLYHIDDLPFPVSQTPEVFTHFRKEVEKMAKVRATWAAPKKMNFPSDLEPSLFGEVPTLQLMDWRNPPGMPNRGWRLKVESNPDLGDFGPTFGRRIY
jgi:deoxyribodipyrimidine photo-lyase